MTMNHPERNILTAAMGSLLALAVLPGIAMAGTPGNLADNSLDDLMNMHVTSVSKKEQSLFKAGGSIFVITQDDIRHSGATNLPDLLRMVPGVDVARISGDAWAISIRGFNARYSGKVLVLIDGRTVYSPGFSGVYWDQQNVPFEDIERIEVIRGPGGTVWGANAMNGVINITTKSARDTHGATVSGVTGTRLRAQGLIQYGGRAGASGDYRVYGGYTSTLDSEPAPGQPADDGGHSLQMGFRSDWNLSGRGGLTVQGELEGISETQTVTTMFSNNLPNVFTFEDAVHVASGHILGRWEHTFANGSEAAIQLYYDRFRRLDQALNIVNTGDAELQYRFHAGARNDIVSGLNLRVSDQVYINGNEVSMGNGQRRDRLFSGFIQDEFMLSPTLTFTAGTKIEHNSYTGYEYEPSAQLVWSPDSRNTVWTSVARAIQQPSWLESGAELDLATVPIPGVSFGLIHLSGNSAIQAPTVIDYELGYRAEVSKRLTLDTTVFLGDYRRQLTDEPLAPYFSLTPAPPHLVIPSRFANFGNAINYGIESSARVELAKWWRVSPGFSYLQSDLSLDPASHDTTFRTISGNSPKYQGRLISTVGLGHGLEWDTSAYYVGELPGASTAHGVVPAFTRVDTRVGWRFAESSEFSVGGENLLSPCHLEFLDSYQITATETARALVARLTWRY